VLSPGRLVGAVSPARLAPEAAGADRVPVKVGAQRSGVQRNGAERRPQGLALTGWRCLPGC
jgi:hypothetical protein